MEMDTNCSFYNVVDLPEHQAYSSDTICSTLNDLRKNGEFCDVNLVVDNVIYPVHKSVLATCSPVLKAMFAGEFAEKSQTSVNLSSVEGCVMENILEYAYTATTLITVNNAQSILCAAHYLQVIPLFKKCYKVLEDNLSVKNCLSIFSLAELYSCPGLEMKAKDFALENFSEVCRESEFLELDSVQLLELIRSDSLKVEKEDSVFVAVVCWFQHKEDKRITSLEKIMNNVRLAHVDSSLLQDTLRTVEALRKSSSFMRLVDEANMYKLLPSRRATLESLITRRRFHGPVVETIQVMYSVINGRRGGTQMFSFTEDGQKVDPDVVIPKGERTYDFLCFPSNYKLLGMAGNNGQRLWLYDYERNEWNSIAPVLEKRMNIAFCEMDGYWYAVGGHSNGSISNVVERYSPDTNSWEKVAPLPHAVYDPAVVSVEGMLYVLGEDAIKSGTDGDVCLYNVFQKYDSRSCSWKTMPSFPADTLNPLYACALNRRIYVCSVSLEREFHVFNISTSQWEHGPDMKRDFRTGPVAMNGSIFVTTCPGGSEKSLVDQYSPTTGLWDDFALFPADFINDYACLYLKGPFLFSRKWFTTVKDESKVVLFAKSGRWMENEDVRAS